MFRFFTVFCLCLFSFGVYGQDEIYKEHDIEHIEGDCFFQTYSKDKFTNEMVKQTKFNPLFRKFGGNADMMDIAGSSVGSTKYLILRWYRSEIFSISEGDKLWLLLEDGDVVELQAAFREIAETVTVGGLWQGVLYYKVSNSDIDVLSKNLITDIRIFSTGGYVDHELKRKKLWSRIGKALECIR